MNNSSRTLLYIVPTNYNLVYKKETEIKNNIHHITENKKDSLANIPKNLFNL